MKKTILMSALAFGLSMNLVSFAHMGDSAHGKNNPCMKIAVACESAGYRLNDNMPGKNIWRDCVKPVIAGKTIAGVTVDPTDIQTCKMHKAAWKMKHKMMMQQNSTGR